MSTGDHGLGYVPSFGNPMMRGPYQLGTTLRPWKACGFYLNGRCERLQDMVDRHLNQPLGFPNGGPYFEVEPNREPGKADVLLTFNEYGCATALDVNDLNSPRQAEGWLSYREVIMMVPVMQKTAHEKDKRVWFLPVIFIDGIDPQLVAVFPITMGREIYGLPKTAGRIWFYPPNEYRPWMRFGKLDALVADADHCYRLTPKPVIRVQQDLRPPRSAGITDETTLADSTPEPEPTEASANPFKQDLVGLKQLPTAKHLGGAAYQAVVSTSLTPDSDVFPTQLHRGYTITFEKAGDQNQPGHYDLAYAFGLDSDKIRIPPSTLRSFKWESTAKFARETCVWTREGVGQ